MCVCAFLHGVVFSFRDKIWAKRSPSTLNPKSTGLGPRGSRGVEHLFGKPMCFDSAADVEAAGVMWLEAPWGGGIVGDLGLPIVSIQEYIW